MEEKLAQPPTEPRARELWLQHAAGYILFRDMRQYAIEQIPENVDDVVKAARIQGIDDAVYGLMMILDGVGGGLWNDEYQVKLQNFVLLMRGNEELERIDLSQGDGMCIGYHYWMEKNFGEDPIVIEKG